MNINPGELNQKIKIVKRTETKDSDGFPVETESVFHECYSKVSNTSGTEIIKANAEFEEVKTRFLIRYTLKPINSDMLILFKTKYYEINYINNYNFSNEYIEIMATRLELV